MIKRWHYALVAVLVIFTFGFCNGELCNCLGSCIDNFCNCTNSSGIYEIGCTICESRTRLTQNEGVIYSHNFTTSSGYTNVSSCSVLIESPEGTTIRLYLNIFKTECSWDFLHIHDGASPFNQTIAVFGGYLINREYDESLLKQDEEVLSTSNQIYMVFRPDQFVNHDGFSIAYKVDGCPNQCSNHGTCLEGTCQCNDGWHGDWCEVESCNCLNSGTCEDGRCVCPENYRGDNCQIDVLKNWWTYLQSSSSSPGGRANFGGTRVGDEYWVFGGYHLDGTSPGIKMSKYNILTDTWIRENDSGPVYRDGHTLTGYDSCLFMFGGQVNNKITDDLWKYNITSSQWHQMNPQNSRMSSMGHCAVLVNSTIYYIGGIDHNGIVIIDIQTYDIEDDVWTIISHRDMTRAFYDADSKDNGFDDERIYHGRYSPSCVYNPVSDRITVFGGLNTTRLMGDNADYWQQDETETIREATFVEYDIYLNHWSNFYMADLNTVPMLYLGAMALIDRNLVIFGGRYVHIGETQCFNVQPYIVNIETGEGKPILSYNNLTKVGPVRMGLGSFTYNNSVYFVGGYNGKLHDDVILYHISRCEAHTNSTRCTEKREDFTKCQWNTTSNQCYTVPISDCGRLKCYAQCPAGDSFDKRCVACNSDPNCVWDQGYPDTCRDKTVVNITGNDMDYQCVEAPSKPTRIKCAEYKLCEHCKDECYWNSDDTNTPKCDVNIGLSRPEVDCETINKPCNMYKECDKCVSDAAKGCMWCQLQLNQLSSDKEDGSRVGQCLDTSLYHVLYPYGQCVQWSMFPTACPEDSCAGHGNCTLCQAQPECGWCEDGTGTGSGDCLSGTYHTPLSQNLCSANSWFYDTCPLCQCNGHSNCTDHKNCDECQGNTTGSRCDSCIDGYYGDATNNGICTPCDCSRHSDEDCNNRSGRCTCNTDGVGGVRCDKCLNAYVGDLETNPKETCYSLLEMDRTTEFELKTLKRNFMIKLSEDVRSDVTIGIMSGSNVFRLNLTLTYTEQISNFMQKTHWKHDISGKWQMTFKRSKYEWDKKTAEIRMYLTFQNQEEDPKISVTISVQQAANQIDLKKFFIYFFACIVILLLIFLLAWTAKIRYSQYRNQRHQEIQLLERALRPYKTHKILFRDSFTPTPGRIFEIRPLGIEPLSDEKYAIVSYLLTMPGPKDVNLAIVSSSFVTSMAFGKVISNPNVHFES